MSRRRKPHTYTIEPTPAPSPTAGKGVGDWFKNQIWNTSLLWLMGMFFIGVGFYFNTINTQANQEITIKRLEATLGETKKEDKEARDKVREQFLSGQQKTTDILSKLDSRLAVSETKQETTNQSLGKIVDQLQQLNAASRNNGRSR